MGGWKLTPVIPKGLFLQRCKVYFLKLLGIHFPMILEAFLKDPKCLAEGVRGGCDYKDFLKFVMASVLSTQNIAIVTVMLVSS